MSDPIIDGTSRARDLVEAIVETSPVIDTFCHKTLSKDVGRYQTIVQICEGRYGVELRDTLYAHWSGVMVSELGISRHQLLLDYLEPFATYANVGVLHGISKHRVINNIRPFMQKFPHLQNAVNIKLTVCDQIHRQLASRAPLDYVMIVSWSCTHRLSNETIARKLGVRSSLVMEVLERAARGEFGELVQRMRRGLPLIPTVVVEPAVNPPVVVEPVMNPPVVVEPVMNPPPAATPQQKSKPAATPQQKSKPAVTAQQTTKPAANRPPVVKRALDATTTGNTEFQSVHPQTTDRALRILNWIMRNKASYAQAADHFNVTAHYIRVIVGNAWDGKYGARIQSTVMRNIPQEEPEPESYAETTAKRARPSTEAAEPSLLVPPQISAAVLEEAPSLLSAPQISAAVSEEVPSLLSPPQISVAVSEEEAWLLAGSFFAEPSDDF